MIESQGFDLPCCLVLYHILPINEQLNNLMLIVHDVHPRPSREVIYKSHKLSITVQGHGLC